MRPSEPSLVQLWLSGGLDLSEQLQKEAPQRPAEDDDRRPAPRRDMGVFNLGIHRSLRLYNVLAGLLCGVLAVLMLLTAADLPPTAPTPPPPSTRWPGAMWSRAPRRPAR